MVPDTWILPDSGADTSGIRGIACLPRGYINKRKRRPQKCVISRVSTRQKNQLQQQKSRNPTKFTFCSIDIFISFKQFLSKLFVQLSLSPLCKMLEAKEMESSAALVRKCHVLQFCILFLKNQYDSPIDIIQLSIELISKTNDDYNPIAFNIAPIIPIGSGSVDCGVGLVDQPSHNNIPNDLVSCKGDILIFTASQAHPLPSKHWSKQLPMNMSQLSPLRRRWASNSVFRVAEPILGPWTQAR